MGIYILVLLTVLVPAIVISVHVISPDNRVTLYFVPEFVSGHIKQPKSRIRRMGIAWSAVAIWLFVLGFNIASLSTSLTEFEFWLMGISLFCWMLGIVLFIAGLYYLVSSLLRRGNFINAGLASAEPVIDKRDLLVYLKKVRVYTIINLISLVVLIGSIIGQIILKVSTFDPVLIIIFFFSFIKMREYVVKATVSMPMIAQRECDHWSVRYINTLPWFYAFFLIEHLGQAV